MSTRKYACASCDRSFEKKSDLRRHENSLHDKKQMLFCQFPGCNRATRGFSRKDNYDQHLQSHRATGQEPSTSKHTLRRRPVEVFPENGQDFSRMSRAEVISMLQESERRLALEEEGRRRAEEELARLKARYDRLEEMCFKLMEKNL